MAGHVVNLEFISANPTGPLHIGHTRWAALGDSMRRLLTASGAEVTAEYYINDAGAQMDNFGASVPACAKGEPTPEGGYPGPYIDDLAQTALAARPDLLELPDAEALGTAREIGYEAQLADIRSTLEDFGVYFDVWFSEKTLHEGVPSSPRSPACASRATSTTVTEPCGCAPPTSATTRTASSSAPTGCRPTSPPTPRTT